MYLFSYFSSNENLITHIFTSCAKFHFCSKIISFNIKISYYWFNRQELLKKAKEKYDNGGKEKAAKYYQDNKDVIKEKEKNKYKNLSEEEKKAKRQYYKNRYNKMKEKLS